MSTLTSPSPQTTSQPKSELEDFDGKISIARAFPYGLQHVLAMFVANLAPIAIIASAAGFDDATTAMLIQNAMIVAGIGTFIQLFPIWRIGARMPIVMGVSFTFVTVLCGIAAIMAIPLRSEPLSLAVCSRAFWAYSLNTGANSSHPLSLQS